MILKLAEVPLKTKFGTFTEIVQGFFCKKDLAYFGNRDENKETLAR